MTENLKNPWVLVPAIALLVTLITAGTLSGIFGWVPRAEFKEHIERKNIEYRELRTAQEKTARKIEKVSVDIEWIKRELEKSR